MKKGFTRLLLFVSIVVLAASCMNYNKIQKVNRRKAPKQELVVQAQEEPSSFDSSADGDIQETSTEEDGVISNSTSSGDTVLLKNNELITPPENPEVLTQNSERGTNEEKGGIKNEVRKQKVQSKSQSELYMSKAKLWLLVGFIALLIAAGLAFLIFLSIGSILWWELVVVIFAFALPVVFFVLSIISMIKSGKASSVKSEAGLDAKTRFKRAVRFGMWALIALAATIGLVIFFASFSFLFGTLIAAAIFGSAPVIFYVLALIQIIKSAKLSRIHKLTRPEGDTSGDRLRRTTWTLIFLGSLFSLILAPLVLLTAIIITNTARKG